MLGVEISSNAAKIIEITGTSERCYIRAVGSKIFPTGAVQGNTIVNIDAVSSCLRQILDSGSFSTREAVMAVPDSKVISKIIPIHESLHKIEIEEMVCLEAQKFLPDASGTVNADFQILGASAENPSFLDVLITVTRAENIQKYLLAASGASLQLKIIDVESCGVERVMQFCGQRQDKMVLVLDIGATFLNFFVMSGGKVIYSQEESSGSNAMIQHLASFYGCSTQETVYRIYQSDCIDEYAQQQIDGFTAKIVAKIQRILQFFLTTGPYQPPDTIVLTGGVARLPGLDHHLQNDTGISVNVLNPFSYMTISDAVDSEQLMYLGPSYMAACGLALRQEL